MYREKTGNVSRKTGSASDMSFRFAFRCDSMVFLVFRNGHQTESSKSTEMTVARAGITLPTLRTIETIATASASSSPPEQTRDRIL